MWKNLQDKQPSHSNQYTARILKTEKKKWGQEKKKRVGEEKIIKRWREGAKEKKTNIKRDFNKNNHISTNHCDPYSNPNSNR